MNLVLVIQSMVQRPLLLWPAGYAFSTYGEVAACWVQDIVLVGLIARHMRTGHKRLAAAVAAFAVYCWWLVSGLCSVETLTGADSQRAVGQVPGAEMHRLCMSHLQSMCGRQGCRPADAPAGGSNITHRLEGMLSCSPALAEQLRRTLLVRANP